MITQDQLEHELQEYVRRLKGGVTLTLPWPPSMNTYWRTFQGRMIISAKGRDYRKAVAEQVLIQRGAKHYTGKLRVQIEAFRPDNRRRDLDNLLKAVLDGCTHAGVWEDDSNIVDLRIYWAESIGGMLKVKVSEVMNDEALKVKWFSGSKGTVGIAKVKTFDGDIEYRISPVDGFLEHMDVQQIVAWGAWFPIEAGEALFVEET